MFPDWGIPCFILNSEWNSKLIKIRLLTPRVQGYVFERLWCVTCYLNSLSLTETSLVQKATFTIFCRSSSLLSLLTGLLNWETTVLNCKTEVWEVFYLLNNIFSQLGKGLIQETTFGFFFLVFSIDRPTENISHAWHAAGCMQVLWYSGRWLHFSVSHCLQFSVFPSSRVFCKTHLILSPCGIPWCEYTQSILYWYLNKFGLTNRIKFWPFTYITLS